MGFVHKHMRPDRDEYVDIVLDNVKPSERENLYSALVKDVVPVFRLRALLGQNSRDIFFLS